jgi:hypothetical protein
MTLINNLKDKKYLYSGNNEDKFEFSIEKILETILAEVRKKELIF